MNLPILRFTTTIAWLFSMKYGRLMESQRGASELVALLRVLMNWMC
jgi:hypothetical protein